MAKRPHSRTILSTKERAEVGIIVTFVNERTGDLRTRHRYGWYIEVRKGRRSFRETIKREIYSVRECLLELIELSETWGGGWLVQTVSTPQTIWADMQGRDVMTQKMITPPEFTLLRQVGRVDLWADDPKRRNGANTRHIRRRVAAAAVPG